MSVVNEAEQANGLSDLDTSQLLRMPNMGTTSSMANPLPDEAQVGATASSVCPAHPIDDCLCHGLMGDWEVPAPTVDPALSLPEPDYSRFQDYIPGFIQPEKRCDYCRSKNLECYMKSGDTTCRACFSLFRECSLTNSNTLEASNYVNNSSGAFLDTLHAVDEDTCREKGTFTGIKPLNSKGRSGGTSTPTRLDDYPGSTKRNGIRFPRQAVKVLREWLDANQNHPYPSEEEKAELERKTELKPSQVANWLANARRRAKATRQSRPKLIMSPSLRPSTPAINILEPDKPWEELNPLERWKNSPPENEPAALPDIVNAVESSAFPAEAASPSSFETSRRKGSSFGSHSRPASTTSFETSHGSSFSASSAAHSHGSSHGSFGSFSSSLAGKKDRRRRRKNGITQTRNPLDEKKRIFQCTFCTDTFKSKYDWTRHEKSLHLSLEKWICAPLGPFITDKVTGKKTCVYCGLQHPPNDLPDDHGEIHNHHACEDKGIDARTFYRKDHLRQHLRLMHNCEMTPSMDAWKVTAVYINSRCGFCSQRFSVWQERVDHLTAHFKAGARMAQWKGCRGLDPAVAAQVTNAMPPYLIGIEAASPNPFSATGRTMENYHTSSVQVGLGQLQKDASLYKRTDTTCGVGEHTTSTDSGKATCWEILTVRLGKYTNEMAAQNIVVTDEMLQSHARQILYGSDDTWNQTAADNPEWLDLFKKSHGLDFIPSAIGGQGSMVPEDLETYTDLGLRIPFAVQLLAYNKTQIENRQSMFTMPSPYEHAAKHRRQQARSLYHSLSKEGVLHGADYRCQHAECEKNVVDMRAFEDSSCSKPKQRRWCTYQLPPEKAKMLANKIMPSQRDANADSNVNSALTTDSNLQNANARKQGLDALQALDNTDENCCWIEHDALIASARAKINNQEIIQSGNINDCPNIENSHQLQPDSSRALSMGLQARSDIEDATAAAMHERAERLRTAQSGEIDNCLYRLESWGLDNERQMEADRARALANGLQTLINLEAAELEDNYGPNGIPPREQKRTYKPWHKHELPPDRARRFATLTGAWEDSGKMPAQQPTGLPLSPPTIQQTNSVSTGAIMEFLGGNVGADLQFANDTTSSQIPLPNSEQTRIEQQEDYPYPLIDMNAQCNDTGPSDPHDWFGGTDHWVDESVLMKDLDDLIAATTAPIEFAGVSTSNAPTSFHATSGLDEPCSSIEVALMKDISGPGDGGIPTGIDAGDAAMDMPMLDAGFDDLNFDSVFDFDGMTDNIGHSQS